MAQSLNLKRAYKNGLLALFLFLNINPVIAKAKIESIYFQDDNKIIFELEKQDFPQMTEFNKNFDDSFSMIISDTGLKSGVSKLIGNEKYNVSFQEDKSATRKFFQTNDVVLVNIQSKDAQAIKLVTNPLLEGLSYQISIEDIKEDTHYLEVQNETNNINDLAASLKTALKEDSENLNAHLNLAKLEEDPQEKLNHYLSSISNEALLAIGDAWFIQAQEKGNSSDFSKAMIPFQFVILKEPSNPEYRYRFARVLEDSGIAFFAQASKRYLEAAALAKQLFLAGDNNMQVLLRNATESLIKTLAMQGRLEEASKYCNSYLNLGFQNFINGKKILAIAKELNQNKNPFGGNI